MTLSPRVPDLPSLELLVSVGRFGSIGRAAAAHGISQPAASHRLRTMERLVGMPLLDRTPRGSRLTTQGALLVEWSGSVVDAARALDTGIDALRQGSDSRLRLSANFTIAEYLLPGWLMVLRVRRPDTKVSLTVANSRGVVAALRAREIDLGFVEGKAIREELDSMVVARDNLVVITAPSHEWAKRGTVTAAELCETPLVCREEGSGTRAALAEAVRKEGQLAPPHLELASTSVVKAAVRSGAGPAVLSSLAVREEIAEDLLCAVPVEDVDLRRELCAVWTAGARPVGPAADLLAAITAEQEASR